MGMIAINASVEYHTLYECLPIIFVSVGSLELFDMSGGECRIHYVSLMIPTSTRRRTTPLSILTFRHFQYQAHESERWFYILTTRNLKNSTNRVFFRSLNTNPLTDFSNIQSNMTSQNRENDFKTSKDHPFQIFLGPIATS